MRNKILTIGMVTLFSFFICGCGESTIEQVSTSVEESSAKEFTSTIEDKSKIDKWNANIKEWKDLDILWYSPEEISRAWEYGTYDTDLNNVIKSFWSATYGDDPIALYSVNRGAYVGIYYDNGVKRTLFYFPENTMKQFGLEETEDCSYKFSVIYNSDGYRESVINISNSLISKWQTEVNSVTEMARENIFPEVKPFVSGVDENDWTIGKRAYRSKDISFLYPTGPATLTDVGYSKYAIDIESFEVTGVKAYYTSNDYVVSYIFKGTTDGKSPMFKLNVFDEEGYLINTVSIGLPDSSQGTKIKSEGTITLSGKATELDFAENMDDKNSSLNSDSEASEQFNEQLTETLIIKSIDELQQFVTNSNNNGKLVSIEAELGGIWENSNEYGLIIQTDERFVWISGQGLIENVDVSMGDKVLFEGRFIYEEGAEVPAFQTSNIQILEKSKYELPSSVEDKYSGEENKEQVDIALLIDELFPAESGWVIEDQSTQNMVQGYFDIPIGKDYNYSDRKLQRYYENGEWDKRDDYLTAVECVILSVSNYRTMEGGRVCIDPAGRVLVTGGFRDVPVDSAFYRIR